MIRLYLPENNSFEQCFNIENSAPLSDKELELLKRILAHGFVQESIFQKSQLLNDKGNVVELGPRLNFATAFHTNVSQIIKNCGLDKVVRIERSRRYLLPPEENIDDFIAKNHDRMTEMPYTEKLTTYATGIVPEPVYEIDMMNKGPNALKDIPGLAVDETDRQFYYDYFVKRCKRNPTIVELMDLNNANSDHSRHTFFKGKHVLDGEEQTETLFEIIQAAWKAFPGNNVIAFSDNSSAIKGYKVTTIIPEQPGQASRFVKRNITYNIIFTAETHNFPTGIAPFPGAETGTGGRIRDVQATGRGGLVVAGSAAYCVGNLFMSGYELPWENPKHVYPNHLAPSIQVLIEASDGASDYGNKFGEPVILGSARSFHQVLPDGQHWGWGKKVMFTGGIGFMDERHTHKQPAAKGMLIVEIGGPAYRIGVGGGAASSFMQGDNEQELDFNAVQRGDAEMEQKVNRVIRACIEMGEDNPIMSIHDQGAGGPANVLKELVEEAGGKIDIRQINSGDNTLSVLELWIAEYQERNGFLIKKENIEAFKDICQREKVKCEILGEVTGDKRFIVYDSQDGSTPVDLELDRVLSGLPQKVFTDNKVKSLLKRLIIPKGTNLIYALELVLKNLTVASKRHLTSKVDRSVTGLVVQQQCCGPLQLPVADVGVVALSHFTRRGAATSLGEQPIKMLLDPAKGARLSVAEALTNMVWVKISKLNDIDCSANWMWATKLPGEDVALFEAARALRDILLALGVGFIVDGGKDSSSMALKHRGLTIKSPRQLKISAYAPVPDITKVVTPDIKQPGDSKIYLIKLSNGYRLGGSILAQIFGQVGKVCPDVDETQLIIAFKAVQQLIGQDLLLAGHDVSDGGLITALLEMAFSGNCGLIADLKGKNVWNLLFNEEPGLLMEVANTNVHKVEEIILMHGLQMIDVANTTEEKNINVYHDGQLKLSESMEKLRSLWEETSYQIERLQKNIKSAEEEKKNNYSRPGINYFTSFQPSVVHIHKKQPKVKMAILREEGSNGDREMTSAFQMAGFETWDVNMQHLLKGDIKLNDFRCLVTVGGFSFADYPSSAKGWAAVTRENEQQSEMFESYYLLQNTLSLGICNGFQWQTLMRWLPDHGLTDKQQPRLIQNESRKFESRWVSTKILPSPAIMLQGMEHSRLGIWVAHGEGRMYFPESGMIESLFTKNLVPLVYTDDFGQSTESYPFNPNGSPRGIAALCTADGRHLGMMPHPERAFLKWQWPYLPKQLDIEWTASPWLQMFKNAYAWCINH